MANNGVPLTIINDGDTNIQDTEKRINDQGKPTEEPDGFEKQKLRGYLKLCLYAPMKWKERCCSINLIYFAVFVLQLVKLSLVTAQIVNLNDDRKQFSDIVNRGHTTLRHLLLKEWDASWETLPYPPTHGDFAAYDISNLEGRINYAVEGYYNAEIDAKGYFTRRLDDKMVLKMKYFDLDGFFDNKITSNLVVHDISIKVEHGLTSHINPLTNETIYSYNISKELHTIFQPLKRLLSLKLGFTIHSVRVEDITKQACCLYVQGWVTFEDLKDNGEVIANLDTLAQIIHCQEMNVTIRDWTFESLLEVQLRIAVSFFCTLSLLAIVAFLSFAGFVYKKTKKYMGQHYKQDYRPIDDKENDLPCSEYMRIFHKWDTVFGFADVCTLVGTWSGQTLDIGWDLSMFDSNTVWLGSGCLLHWMSILHFFRFHEKFHLLFKTIRIAFPNVITYFTCVVVLFTGFWLCGYVVMGPYHVKFQSLSATAETLISMLNGDEIFATFSNLQVDKVGKTAQNNLWWFSRLYIYVYIIMFSIIVINLVIAIFNSAYDVIQDNKKDKMASESMDVSKDHAAHATQMLTQCKSKFYTNLQELVNYQEDQMSDKEKRLQAELKQIVAKSLCKPNITLNTFIQGGNGLAKESTVWGIKCLCPWW